MLKKLAKKLTNNIGLKILATVFAVALWIVVYNIDDPIKGKTITTNVTFENTDYITKMGKCYEVLDGNNTVTFYFTAQRSVYENITPSSFSAVADMEKIEFNEETNIYRVPVVVTPVKNVNSINIATKQMYIELGLEDRMSIQKPIKANTVGTVADGCALGNVRIANTNVIKISGPESIVSTIDTATATINVEGMSADITDSVIPVLYDVEGNAVDTTKLEMSLNTVSISAQILGTKDIEMEFETMGNPAEGYKMTGISSNPQTIRIKAENAILNTIDKITIPSEVLDLTDVTEDIEKTIDITSYLPEGASVVISSEAKVEVTVSIAKVTTKTYKVPVENIQIQGLAENYKAALEGEFVEIEITGVKDDLKKLDEDKIQVILDASTLGAGNHKVPVYAAVDENLYEARRAKVTINIEEMAVPDTDSETADSENTAGSNPENGSTEAAGNNSGEGTGDNSDVDSESAESNPVETPENEITEDNTQNTTGTVTENGQN